MRKSPWRKADSTLRASRAVPHPSTNRALRRLTSEVRRDPVYSTRYGRQRTISVSTRPNTPQAAIKSAKKLFTLLDLCVSSLRRGHANLLCIVPILTDDPRRESIKVGCEVGDESLLPRTPQDGKRTGNFFSGKERATFPPLVKSPRASTTNSPS